MAKANSPQLPDGYGQLCAVAQSLDVVGARWNLLLLRDLARTPLRFTDLQAINPTISPTLLTQRLRSLEAAGVVQRRTTRGPSRAAVYALADTSRPQITAVLSALADLGAHLLEVNPPPADPAEALAEQMRLNSHFVLARASELEGYFVLDLTGWRNHIVITAADFVSDVEPPANREPDAVATFFPPTTLMRIMGRVQSIDQAEADGLLTIDGDRDRVIELIDLLSFPDPESS